MAKSISITTASEHYTMRSDHLRAADLEYYKRRCEVLQDCLDLIFDQSKAGETTALYRGCESVHLIAKRTESAACPGSS